jgi:hypothetical protein
MLRNSSGMCLTSRRFEHAGAGLCSSEPAEGPETSIVFIEAFKRPLQEPLIASPPRLRITKDAKDAVDSDFLPKRNARRLAAKSKFRAAKPDVQARKVLMKKLGLDIETNKPEASFEKFQEVVATTPLHVRREAIEALFPGRCLIRGLVRDVE